MNILLITDSYPPEIRSASQIMGELAGELKTRGHKVTVLTTLPRYNIAENESGMRFQPSMDEEGIHVIRLKTLAIHNVGPIVRGIANLALPYSFTRAAKKYIKGKIDTIIVYSPPLTLGIAGKWLKKYFKAKLIVNIQDIFPQQAIDLGLMKQRSLIAFFEWIEKSVYKGADSITVHSEGNRTLLVQRKGVDPSKVEIVHNWIDSLPYDVLPSGKFRKMYSLEGKFVLLYAGIIGLPQGLDKILDTAKLLKDEKDIVFLMVGGGLEKKMLEERCSREGIDNVVFKDFVSLKEYPELVKECDMGIVSLSSKNKTPVVPGKLMGYMAAEIPVAAILNKESDGHAIINDSQCGFASMPDNIEGLIDFIKKIKKDTIMKKKMGKSGKEYLHKHFSKKMSVNKYEHLFTLTGGQAHDQRTLS